jgi:twitching motility protein PilT
MITMEELLALMVRQGGSDLHISVGSPPRIRIDGELMPVDHPALNGDDTRRLGTSVLSSDQIAKVDRELELDCSFGLEGFGRFRANVFYQQGAMAAVMRAIPTGIPDFEQLGMPRAVCERICSMKSGLVLVAPPAASPPAAPRWWTGCASARGRICSRTRSPRRSPPPRSRSST